MIIATNPCLFFPAIALTSWDWPYPTFRLEDYIYEDQHKEHKGKSCVLHCKDDKRFQMVDLSISSLGKDLLNDRFEWVFLVFQVKCRDLFL